MKKFDKEKLKFVFTVVTFSMLILIMIPVSAYGWFAMKQDASAEDLSLKVVSKSSSQIDVSFLPNGDEGIVKLRGMSPGEEVWLKLDVSNLENNDATYKICIDSVTITYPTSDPTFSGYKKNLIKTNDYFNADNVRLNSDLITIDHFKKFIAPASNAFKYGLFAQNAVDESFSQSENYITEITTKQASITKDKILINKNVPLSYASGDNLGQGFVVNEDGSFTVSGNTKVSMFMIVYFSPNRYQSADIIIDETEHIGVQLRNSNPYIMQDVAIGVSLNTI